MQRIRKCLDRDTIKLVTMGMMLFTHTVSWLDPPAYPEYPTWLLLLSTLGLFAPPAMFWFLADGFRYTKSRKKYARRLLLCACLTQIPTWLLFAKTDGWWESNVLFTLFFALLALMAWESGKARWVRITCVVLCCLAALAIQSDWLAFGVLYPFFLHVFREKPRKKLIAYTVLSAVHAGIMFVTYSGRMRLIGGVGEFIVLMASYFVLNCIYSGKKSTHFRIPAWVFYAFYPAHCLLIFALRFVLR